MKDASDAGHAAKDALLPVGSPHNELYDKVVPIWCGTSPDELDGTIGEGYGCGFSAGFERGLIAAMLKPEWAQGFYHKLREYYLATHSAEDLLDWEDLAEETARAIPFGFSAPS